MRSLALLWFFGCALALHVGYSAAFEEDELANKLSTLKIGKGETPAEIWKATGKVPRLPKGFNLLTTKEPRIRPQEGPIRVPKGFEDKWEVYGWGRNMALAPLGTKALADAKKKEAQSDDSDSDNEELINEKPKAFEEDELANKLSTLKIGKVEDELANKLGNLKIGKGETPAEIWKATGKVPRSPKGFNLLTTKEPRIRPQEGPIRVPKGFEDKWEVYGWGRNMALAPLGTKALADAEKKEAQSDDSDSDNEELINEKPKALGKSKSTQREKNGSPAQQTSKSPDRARSKSPEPQASKSPERQPSKSPERQPSKSPERRRSKSPERQGSKSPERKTSISPERQKSRSPQRQRSKSPTRRAEAPEDWKSKPLTTVYQKNKPWWITPKNDFKLDLDLHGAKGSKTNGDKLEGQKVSAIFANRNLHLAQVFEVDDKIVKSFKPDGTGNQIPSAKEQEKACKMEVCIYGLPKSGILLIDDEILQPVPSDASDAKSAGIFYVKNGQQLRRYCPADYTQSQYYKCDSGKFRDSNNNVVEAKDMVCENSYVPHVFYHKKQCNSLDKESVMFYSGYIIPSGKKTETPLYYPLLDICWNVANAMPYWSKIRVHGRNTRAKCATRSGDFVAPPSGIYAQSPAKSFLQANKLKAYEEFIGISSAFNFLGGVDRGHFTALKDAVYFAWQLLTNEYMNQAPQHALPNELNHMLLEKATRKYVEKRNETIYIVTGPIGYIRKEYVSLEQFRLNMTEAEEQQYDAAKKQKDGDKIFWLDTEHQQLPFNMYYAKILYNPERKSGMAFITSNLPVKHNIDKLCTDVCDEYGWIGTMDRFAFEKGFAYCCKVDEFLNLFPYFGESLKDIFPKKLSSIAPLSHDDQPKNGDNPAAGG